MEKNGEKLTRGTHGLHTEEWREIGREDEELVRKKYLLA